MGKKNVGPGDTAVSKRDPKASSSADKPPSKPARKARQAQAHALTDLAARIRTEHEATIAGFQRGLKHALAVGDLLIEAKYLVKHGEWIPWIEANCEMDVRTAQLYMRLARSRSEIEAKANAKNLTHLSVDAAFKLLAPPVEEDESATPSTLNALGKPRSESYDPNYRMSYRPTNSHLLRPMPVGTPYVGDPDPADAKPPVPNTVRVEVTKSELQYSTKGYAKEPDEPAEPAEATTITFQTPGPCRTRRVFNTPDTSSDDACDAPDEALPDESSEERAQRLRSAFLWRAQETIRFAYVDDLSEVKVDQEILTAAEQAAEAWANLAKELRGRSSS